MLITGLTPPVPIQYVSGGALKFALLVSSQVTLMPMVQGAHLEKHGDWDV